MTAELQGEYNLDGGESKTLSLLLSSGKNMELSSYRDSRQVGWDVDRDLYSAKKFLDIAEPTLSDHLLVVGDEKFRPVRFLRGPLLNCRLALFDTVQLVAVRRGDTSMHWFLRGDKTAEVAHIGLGAMGLGTAAV